MAKNSIDVYGASGKTNVLNFEPENLHLVTDKTHPLYDERVHLPIEEGMVLNIAELGVLEPIIVWKDPETGLTCVVVGRQRVKHTLEANKLRLKEGKDPLLVPGVVKRGSANQMAKYMVSENEIRQADTPLGRAKKCQMRWSAGTMRTI
jgi:ParB family chromosome partitioning protein